MQIELFAAQFPVTLSLQDNLKQMRSMLEGLPPQSWVVFPEGALSGYAYDLSFLKQLNAQNLRKALNELEGVAREKELYIWFGSLWNKDIRWYNMTFGLTPTGQRFTYRKVNLANVERGVITQGDSLSVHNVNTIHGEVPVGIQICRELRHPEQWRWLAVKGAQVFLHTAFAINDPGILPVWRAHLVSRAAENQRFVVSVNSTGMSGQNSPTTVIAPNGRIIGELPPHVTDRLHVRLDLSLTDDVYVKQTRRELVKVTGN